jgi:CRISPR-associated protein Cmr4
MFQKKLGVIKTLAPLHVGAAAGEESGNLNMIFRDQFSLTGIVPGSSIRGRFRSEMRLRRVNWLEEKLREQKQKVEEIIEDKDRTRLQKLEDLAKSLKIECPTPINENKWYGSEAVANQPESTTESWVKFEYASIVWIPVFCPGQPVVWVSSPRLLSRYKRIANKSDPVPEPYEGSETLKTLPVNNTSKLFFNFGCLTVERPGKNLKVWFPDNLERPAVVVADDEMAMIHDMALYRQSRVALDKEEKRVAGKAFFNTEALPEETILAFPIALKQSVQSSEWQPFDTTAKPTQDQSIKDELYLGGLESIGFGHCEISIMGI